MVSASFWQDRLSIVRESKVQSYQANDHFPNHSTLYLISASEFPA